MGINTISRLLIIFTFLLLSCKQEVKKENKITIEKNIPKIEVSQEKQEKKDKSDLEIILKQQLDIGYTQLYDDSYDISDYKYSEKDLEVILPLLQKNTQNLNSLSSEVFNSKIKKIFGRTILPKSNKKYLTIFFENPCNRNTSYYRNDNTIEVQPLSIHIIKGLNFITELYAIPEIIGYQKQFLDLSNNEKTSNNERTSSDGTLVAIHKWKDVNDLNNKRLFNLKKFVARNEYLFNDNKDHFDWLINNDEYFMKSLISEFGYLEDSKLLIWFIKKYRFETINGKTNGFEYGKLLWHKNCNNKFVFHNLVLEKMKDDESFSDDLNSYINFLIQNNQNFDNLSFKNQAYLIAQIYHSIQNETYEMFAYMGGFAEFQDKNNVYSEEFEKNNYYDLEGFKEEWLQAKVDGNGVSR
ncbi:hypothetical protein Celal_1686 [Cellulophaga algicola DSM 14237]|uniref:Uncharacterized protein n=1 Tax=Cellulophaga algicola (strain DSM 14237 / IC166 / ACAM 630) TaxID=688270 RepID=E6XBY6_CELAD|nr:hypothetical protein [Cellulophaga algicola]ADV48988.1 hypothetical protein Celal_1686 [Cellulophaga algicola DSM 14237]